MNLRPDAGGGELGHDLLPALADRQVIHEEHVEVEAAVRALELVGRDQDWNCPKASL